MGTDLITRRPRGAPAREYDPEIAEEICMRIASSSLSIVTILKSEKAFPCLATVTKWLNSNADFANAYARAKSFQADLLGEDILDIADDKELEAHDKRIRIDARRWLMSKLKPRVYGDKLDVTSGGEALPAMPPVMIDARVQTIMLLAEQRRRQEEEARNLLEE
jgi:hypothetical protein